MTVTQDEFDEHWGRLLACTQSGQLPEAHIKIRYVEAWKDFRLRSVGAWERTVDHYIKTAGDDPWFPTPSKLIALADRVALDVVSPQEPRLAQEERARLRREYEEWLASAEVKELERKILGKE